jgi:quinol monooxygenase YgiN
MNTSIHDQNIHGLPSGHGPSKSSGQRIATSLMPPNRSHIMTRNLSEESTPVTLVNILTVQPADQPELLALLRDNTANTISTLSGWLSTILVASDDKQRIIIYSQWESIANIEAMRKDPRMVACFPRLTALASSDSFIAGVDATARVESIVAGVAAKPADARSATG